MFCPECGTWNRATALACMRCTSNLPEVAGTPSEPPDEEISALTTAASQATNPDEKALLREKLNTARNDRREELDALRHRIRHRVAAVERPDSHMRYQGAQ